VNKVKIFFLTKYKNITNYLSGSRAVRRTVTVTAVKYTVTNGYGADRNRTVISHPPIHTVRTVKKMAVTAEVSVH
jgi:hypothetical protein